MNHNHIAMVNNAPNTNSDLSDKDLYNLCRKYGSDAKMWSRKFAALLPLVERRRIYKKRGFYSIHEFAAKLGGLNRKTVDEVLRTYKKVEGKPLLTKEIEKVGWGKVRAVTSISGEIEEKKLVEMIRNLPKLALEECVR
ncbi:hypothetical protein KKG71_00240 [Patescibacteria group bacterium]|nr:hypothetical protein [Patescibacteria group bacterium]